MIHKRAVLVMVLLLMIGFSVYAQVDCSSQSGTEWSDSGLDLYFDGAYEEAITHFDCAIELGTISSPQYFRRAFAFYQLGQYAEAIDAFTVTIEYDETYSSAYIDRAWANLRLNNIDGTVHADFLRWIELEETDTITSTLDEALQNGNLAIAEGIVYRLTFEAEAGQVFGAAALTAESTDPLIVLVAPDGSPLISDDDSGVNLNSVIRSYTLPVSGTYTLVVSQAGAGGSGEIELAILLNDELRSTNPDNTRIRDSFIVYNLYINDTAEVFTTGGDRLNLRAGPSTNFKIIDRLEPRERVTLLDGPLKNEEGDGFAWWFIRTEDGIEGWAVERVVEEQTLQLALLASEDAYVTSGEDLLNVRETPSRSGSVVFQLEDGVQVTLLEEPVVADNLRWWHIRDTAGREGWTVDRIGIERTLVPTREFPDGI